MDHPVWPTCQEEKRELEFGGPVLDLDSWKESTGRSALEFILTSHPDHPDRPDFGFALRLETFLSWSLLTFWCHLSASDAAWIFWNLLKSSMWFQALQNSPLQKCWDKKVARKLLRPSLVNTEFVQLICFVLKMLFLLSNRWKTLVLSKSFYLWLLEHLRSNLTKLKGNSIICRLSAEMFILKRSSFGSHSEVVNSSPRYCMAASLPLGVFWDVEGLQCLGSQNKSWCWESEVVENSAGTHPPRHCLKWSLVA